MNNEVAAMFAKFHADNPHVFELFKRFAREAKQSGAARYSVYAITERIRWHCEAETKGSEFKLNNRFRPYYARLLVRECPEFVGFFEFRGEDCREAA